ncbi:MAG: hypothetical protein ACR2KT_08675 [Methylocella sp.]
MAVFLRDMPDRFVEMNRLADVATDILYSEGEFIHAMPYRADAYNDARKPQSGVFAEIARVPCEGARLSRRAPLARRGGPRGVSRGTARGARRSFITSLRI